MAEVPPQLTPWKKGQSGNPAGKPKGTRNRSTVIKELLDRCIPFEDIDGIPKSMTVEHAVMASLLKKGMSGDVSAIKEILDSAHGKIAEKQELTGKDGAALQVEKSLSISDREIINRYIQSMTGVKQQKRTMRRMTKGFKNVQKSISKKEGIPMKNAGAILAYASRNASPAAKKKNPAIKKVKGKKK